jgi:hypothetical protein
VWTFDPDDLAPQACQRPVSGLLDRLGDALRML